MAQRIQHYYRRRAAKLVARGLQAIFTRTTVIGRENIPPKGPYIAVGNHVAAIEVALMAVTLPQIVELIGNGDIPLDPTFSMLARWYGFVPIRRGHVDRAALRAAQNVLEQGHVLGIFPEGGIWEHNGLSARPGVAWLSQQTGAPILPMGFGGVLGALGKAVHLQRPRLTVTIGPLMPPVPNPETPRERKTAIEEASREMMARIQALIPPEDRRSEGKPVQEDYHLRVELTAPDGSLVPLPEDIPYGEDVAFYFHRHVLLEVIYRNYRILEAKPLADFPHLTDPVRLGAALDAALQFYRGEPAFLGYRLGYAQAGRVVQGLHGLRSAITWAAERNYQMRIIPERTIIEANGTRRTLTDPSIKREY
jgi:1-acyl-sn-glycerol-3-phosphate acyltransferase